MKAFELASGSPVILYLQGPKEKVWGLLLSILPSGIVVRALDLVMFEEWMRQEARGDDPLLGLTTIFYPMTRLERLERDEGLGPIVSFADRFAMEVGRTVWMAAGLEARPHRARSGRAGQARDRRRPLPARRR